MLVHRTSTSTQQTDAATKVRMILLYMELAVSCIMVITSSVVPVHAHWFGGASIAFSRQQRGGNTRHRGVTGVFPVLRKSPLLPTFWLQIVVFYMASARQHEQYMLPTLQPSSIPSWLFLGFWLLRRGPLNFDVSWGTPKLNPTGRSALRTNHSLYPSLRFSLDPPCE